MFTDLVTPTTDGLSGADAPTEPIKVGTTIPEVFHTQDTQSEMEFNSKSDQEWHTREPSTGMNTLEEVNID